MLLYCIFVDSKEQFSSSSSIFQNEKILAEQ